MNRKKLFFAGGIGNSIEIFEAIVYAFLQPFITKTFFPVNLRENNLLFFVTIILPFLARPLGGILFGVLGDLKGRKSVLEYSMMISGISCALISLVPSYETSGLVSFIAIISLRFLFGIAMSGEYNNSFLYLAEHAAPQSRGYILSWAAFGVSFGLFLATLSAYLFTNLIEKGILPEQSFRLLFLLSTFSLYIGYIARKDLSETAEFFISYPSAEKNKALAIYQVAKQEVSGRLTESIKIILLSGFGTHITYSLLLYGPFHIQSHNIHSIGLKDATLLVAISACISAMIIPLVGKASDIIGRKLLLTLSTAMLTILYLSFFYCTAASYSYQELLCFYLILGCFCGVYFCTAPAEIIASLPKRMRSTVNGLLYGIPAILFGALSLPYFQTLFQSNAHSPLIILVITVPLLAYCLFNKKKFFEANFEYLYPLEKTKVM